MKRDLIWLTAFAAIAFAVLVSLGYWQLQRLAWKEGLIAQIEQRVDATPVPLDAAVARWKKTGDVEYLRVRTGGRFLHDKEMHLFAVIDGKSGWRVFTPLEADGGEIVIADRGFVPDALKKADQRAAGQIPGPVEIVALARRPETPGLFTPDNAADRNIWYWRDLEGMSASALSSRDRERVVPFFLEMEAQSVPGDWPKGGATRLKLSNNHLQYALTWFGLAGTLLVVVIVYVVNRLRQRAVA